MRRVYYPLVPTKTKRFKSKYPAFLIVHTGKDEQFKRACLYRDNIGYTLFDNPGALAAVLTDLAPNTWVITYDVERIASIYNELIKRLDKLSGAGKDNRVLTLEKTGPDNKPVKVTILDAFQYFIKSFPTVIKIVLDKRYPDDIQTQTEYLIMIWEQFTQLLGANFGVYPSATPGATALKIFKHYLPEKLNARGLITNRLLRKSIRPPALHWQPGQYEHAYLYDLNAAYVHVMRSIKFPNELRGFCNKPPRTDKWIALVEIDYKTDYKFSPLSVHIPEEGININPVDVKKYRTVLTYIDALTLSLTGEFKINKFYEGVYWEKEIDLFRAWGNDIERLTLQSQSNKLLLKVISRSLHSKFSQKSTYQSIEIIKTDYKGFQSFIKKKQSRDVVITDNNDFIVTVQKNKRAAFKAYDLPLIESLVMAGARYMMYSAIDKNTVYVHTDSIISTVPRDDLFTDPLKFGAWKLSEEGRANIAGLGIYSIGDKASTAGFNTSVENAIKAIHQAARGIETKVINNTLPGIFKLSSNKGIYTLKNHNYPYAIMRGNTAWVTQSPTRKVKVQTYKRLISSPLDRFNL